MTLTNPFAWVRSHPYYLLAAVFFCIVAVPFLRKADSQFDNVYLRAAARLQVGEDMYPLQDGYLYPPLMAWLAIPFAYVPQMPVRMIWLGINVGCLSLLWIWCWRLAGGTRLNETTDWKEHLICGLGLMCAFRFSVDCLQNQQTDIVVAALVLGGCLALGSSQKLRSNKGLLIAATCFGIAAGMKCTALLFAPYLVCARTLVGGALGRRAGHWSESAAQSREHCRAWLVAERMGATLSLGVHAQRT